MKKVNLKRMFPKGWWKTLLAALLCVGIVGGAAFGIASIFKPDELDDFMNYQTLSVTKFSIGGLDTNGNFLNTNHSILTKDMFECQGLNINPVFDNDISYEIYYYDQDRNFVHTTGLLTGDYSETSIPYIAKYARIVIVPNSDSRVTLNEIIKYYKQVKVTVYRQQNYTDFTKNLITSLEDGYINETGVLTGDNNNKTTNFIDIRPYSKSVMYKTSDAFSAANIIFYNKSKTFISKTGFSSVSQSFTASTGIVYKQIDLSSLPDGTAFIRVYFTSQNSAGNIIRCA